MNKTKIPNIEKHRKLLIESIRKVANRQYKDNRELQQFIYLLMVSSGNNNSLTSNYTLNKKSAIMKKQYYKVNAINI